MMIARPPPFNTTQTLQINVRFRVPCSTSVCVICVPHQSRGTEFFSPSPTPPPGLTRLGYFRFLSVGHPGFPVGLLHQRVTGGAAILTKTAYHVWSWHFSVLRPEKGLEAALPGRSANNHLKHSAVEILIVGISLPGVFAKPRPGGI